MERSKQEVRNRMIAALGLALEEIHHPGAARLAGIDITALIEGVLKEAKAEQVVGFARDELRERAVAEGQSKRTTPLSYGLAMVKD